MSRPLRPKTRVNRIATPDGAGAFLLENPFQCKDALVREAVKLELGITLGVPSTDSFRVTAYGPEFFDATAGVWVRLGFNAGMPTYTPLPADWPPEAGFRFTAQGLEFFDISEDAWMRMTFDAGAPVYNYL